MASKVIGISFQGETLERLDRLAAREGVNRSQMIRRLVERDERASPEVVVDGRPFVPARVKR